MIINKIKKIVKGILRSKAIYKSKNVRSVNNSKQVLDGLVAYNKYGGYFTPLSSQKRPAVQSILSGSVYEPDTISFMRNNCSNGDIIHAGTFFGDFLPGLSGAISNNAKIWAFEPNIENFRCAQITSLINNLNNVKLFNSGVGEINTIVPMQIETVEGISMGGGSTIVNENIEGKTINVKIVKIDDVIPSDRNISILQLDVEGYEKEALQGALNTIIRCNPVLILEDNENVIKTSWFADKILSLGYEIFGEVHNNTLLKIRNTSQHAK